MSTANERQVGGDHYKTGGIELWDLFGPEALMFYAARYVSRWRKKDGVRDLEKAVHVCEKLREIIPQYPDGGMAQLSAEVNLVESWMNNAKLDWVERSVIKNILWWYKQGDIDDAIAGIRYLIENEVPDDLDIKSVLTPERARDVALDYPRERVTTTNTPRAGETEAQIAARERRVPDNKLAPDQFGGPRRSVPRFAAGGTITPPTFEHSVPGNEDGNDAVATAMSVNTTPWVVDEDWLGRSGIGNDLIDRFWTKRAKSLYVLDPHVVSTNIPRTVRHCYAARGDGNWTLEMRVCPASVRAYFPSIPLSQNMKEWEERPEWQRVLYAWSEQESKYKLSEVTEAWHHVEEENEQ